MKPSIEYVCLAKTRTSSLRCAHEQALGLKFSIEIWLVAADVQADLSFHNVCPKRQKCRYICSLLYVGMNGLKSYLTQIAQNSIKVDRFSQL